MKTRTGTQVRFAAAPSLFVALCLLPGTRALAQKLEPLRVGARVSIAAFDSACTRRFRGCASDAFVEGTLVRVTPDTLVVRHGASGVVNVPRTPTQRIVVSMGRSRWRSALYGATLNGLITYAIADLTDASQRSTVRWAGEMAAGGLLAGALFPAERWHRVPDR
jgi:hypothetical protein